MFEGKIRKLGMALSDGFASRAADMRKQAQEHPEAKAALTLRAAVLSDVALIIKDVTQKTE